ncbi:hypothetical protein [Paenibacillus sp. FSL R10-2736]|uniref:hypothetical protein n=1 Tax=Paenibacillus sp. FSL R10-2736 TaxID=2954692 RepID=UPI0030FA372C
MTVPPLLDGANVLIYTANEHCNNYGYVLFEHDNKKVGITAFAVAKYDGDIGYCLFSCDLDWNVIGGTLHDSLQEAKECAKNSSDIPVNWIPIGIHHYEILVERFKNKEYGIEELQSRLNTALMPDPPITEISNRLLDLENDLESILYTQSDSEQYRLAVNVLDAFIDFLRRGH